MKVRRDDESVSITLRKNTLRALGLVLVGFVAGAATMYLVRGGGAPRAELARAEGSREGVSEESASPPIKVRSLASLTDGRPFLGDADAPVTIVEFTDYECPFCRRHARTVLPELRSEYGSSVKYMVLNFPIAAIHPHAMKAAEATECAADQERFWQYHDRLFAHDGLSGVDDLYGHAAALDLDLEAFRSCLRSGEKNALVEEHVRVGRELGVRATPTFLMNGQRVVGAQPIDTFRARLKLLGER